MYVLSSVGMVDGWWWGGGGGGGWIKGKYPFFRQSNLDNIFSDSQA